MATTVSSPFMPRELTLGMHDALINGTVVQDIPSRLVFVQSSSELSNFTEIEPVGTIAAQYGFSNMWQLMPNKTWQSLW